MPTFPRLHDGTVQTPTEGIVELTPAAMASSKGGVAAGGSYMNLLAESWLRERDKQKK